MRKSILKTIILISIIAALGNNAYALDTTETTSSDKSITLVSDDEVGYIEQLNPTIGAIRKFDSTVFNDVDKEHKYYSDIVYAYEHGYIAGYNSEFRPDEYITLAEFSKLLCDSFGAIVPIKVDTTLENVHWAVNYAHKLGIKHYSTVVRNPDSINKEISKQELIKRSLEFIGVTNPVLNDYLYIDGLNVVEDNGTKNYYNDYIAHAYKLGLLSDYDISEFNSSESFTRSEVLHFINKLRHLYIESNKDIEYPTPLVIEKYIDNGVIKFEGEYSDTYKIDIAKVFKNLPSKLIADFIKDGGTITIFQGKLSDIYPDETNDKARGSYLEETNEIHLFISNKSVRNAFPSKAGYLVHEIAHYLYSNKLTDEQKLQIKELTTDETILKDLQRVTSSEYYKESDSEFFSEILRAMYEVKVDPGYYEQIKPVDEWFTGMKAILGDMAF